MWTPRLQFLKAQYPPWFLHSWLLSYSCTSPTAPCLDSHTHTARTGATGYIGGSVLDAIATAHPEWELTVLLRRVPANFESTYPNAKIIKGDYDSSEVISSAAEQADIVVHSGDSDHVAALNAIITGLLKRPTPGYLLHLSGTGIVSDWNSEEYLGRLNPKIWSDLDPKSLQEIRNLPDTAIHRETEKLLFSTIQNHDDKVKIAIMCPPDIYGQGKGLGKTSTVLVSLFVQEALKRGGKVFYHAEGTNTRGWVHINDLMRVYLRVVEAAASGGEEASAHFGENGYHFASTQEHSQLDFAVAAGKILQKHQILKSPEPVQVDLETLDKMEIHPAYPQLARYLFASNSRTRPERAEKLWGYSGQEPGLMECLEDELVSVSNQA